MSVVGDMKDLARAGTSGSGAAIAAGIVSASAALFAGANKEIDTLQIVGLAGANALTQGAANEALILGGGTSAAPVITSEANKNFLEFRAKTTATTAGSDTRCAYLRTTFSGATTGGGETLRAFSTVEAACGTVRGAHVSLNWGASGSVSGLGTALSATLHVLNTGTMTGTLAAVEAQVFIESGSGDDVELPASHGLFRGSISGDTATIDAFVNFLHLELPANQVVDAGTDTTHMVTTGTSDTAPTAALRVNINGTPYWILMAASIAAD